MRCYGSLRDKGVFQQPNSPVVSTPSTTPGWTELPPSQSVFHDNGTGLPERKFIHVDGREAVYDGDTGQVITDPEVAGTYNYVNPGVALTIGTMSVAGQCSSSEVLVMSSSMFCLIWLVEIDVLQVLQF